MKYVGDPTSYPHRFEKAANEPKDSEAAPQGGIEDGAAVEQPAQSDPPRLAPSVAQETRSYAAEVGASREVEAPAWWAPGVRVTDGSRSGVIGTAGTNNGGGWIVALDGGTDYVANANPALWSLEVIQGVNQGQVNRIVYDCQRALLRAFGCHYVAAYDELPESQRPSAVPAGVNRPELAGLQAIVRTAVAEAMAPYKRD